MPTFIVRNSQSVQASHRGDSTFRFMSIVGHTTSNTFYDTSESGITYCYLIGNRASLTIIIYISLPLLYIYSSKDLRLSHTRRQFLHARAARITRQEELPTSVCLAGSRDRAMLFGCRPSHASFPAVPRFGLGDACRGRNDGVVADHFKFNDNNTVSQHIQRTCRSIRQINDTSPSEGSSVVDFHDNFTVVSGVSHFQQRAERMGAMGTSQAVVVNSFPTARPCSG